MSQKLRSKSLSSPEILRRDPYAFVDWHHDPRNVHITDILLDREEGSPSSSEEMLWDLFPCYESPASPRGSLDWLGEHLTPVTTHGPWRFETEEDPSDEELQLPGLMRLTASMNEPEVAEYAEGGEERVELVHNRVQDSRRVTRSGLPR